MAQIDWVWKKAKDTAEKMTGSGFSEKAKEYAKTAKEKASEEIEFINTAETADEQKVDFLKKIIHGASYLILVAVICSTVFHYIGFGTVVGESMMPTYTDGEHFFVSKQSAVSKGDVIILNYDEDNVLIKRVIAEAGDTVEVKNNHVYVNGEKITEGYTQGKTGDMEEVTVGEDEVFVMGDNRENSMDSRAFGTVSMDDVIGKVVAAW